MQKIQALLLFQLPLEKLGLEKTQMSIHTYTDKLLYTNDNIMRFVLIQKSHFMSGI